LIACLAYQKYRKERSSIYSDRWAKAGIPQTASPILRRRGFGDFKNFGRVKYGSLTFDKLRKLLFYGLCCEFLLVPNQPEAPAERSAALKLLRLRGGTP
jgi:hypothetical protein